MDYELEKRSFPDLGQKLDHIEGILGAYLPRRTFQGEVQQKALDCTKSTFSRMRNGLRMTANWELSRLVDMFRLSDYGLDYRIFFLPFEKFDAALKKVGAGSYGTAAAVRLRGELRSRIAFGDTIKIRREHRLNVGGIGAMDESAGLIALRTGDKVTLTVPLKDNAGRDSYLLLLHDFPSGHATSCLRPSIFAPERIVSGAKLRLPQPSSGYLSFPVGGNPGYRCLYAIQSSNDLSKLIGLDDPEFDILDVQDYQIIMLIDALEAEKVSSTFRSTVTFAEYMLL